MGLFNGFNYDKFNSTKTDSHQTEERLKGVLSFVNLYMSTENYYVFNILTETRKSGRIMRIARY